MPKTTTSVKSKSPVADASTAAAVSAGYLLTCSDGRVFTFAGCEFQGDAADSLLGQPIVASAAIPGGYFLCGGDGAVLTFGSARFFGAGTGASLEHPVVAMAA